MLLPLLTRGRSEAEGAFVRQLIDSTAMEKRCLHLDSVTDPDTRGVTAARKPKMPAGPKRRRRQSDMLVRERREGQASVISSLECA